MRAGDVDGEAVHEGAEELLAHRGGLAARPRDAVRGAERDQLSLDFGDFRPRHIPQDQRVMQAQDLAVHMIDGPPLLVSDIEFSPRRKNRSRIT